MYRKFTNIVVIWHTLAMVVNYGRNWENRYGFSSGFSDETERSIAFFVAPPLEDDTIQKDKLDRTKRSERERIENISPCAECYSKGRVRFGRGTNDLLTNNHGSFWRTRSHT